MIIIIINIIQLKEIHVMHNLKQNKIKDKNTNIFGIISFIFVDPAFFSSYISLKPILQSANYCSTSECFT